MNKQQILSNQLSGICNFLGAYCTRSEAIKNGAKEYFSIEYAPIYGGYRLVKVNVKTGGHNSAFINMSDTSPRLSYKEFYNYLRGIYAGLYETKLLQCENIINNSDRVFMVTYSYGKSFFCNITDLNKMILSLELKEGYFKIFHFYNNKLKTVTKKDLRAWFAAREIPILFHY